jgi:hypothetical protein
MCLLLTSFACSNTGKSNVEEDNTDNVEQLQIENDSIENAVQESSDGNLITNKSGDVQVYTLANMEVVDSAYRLKLSDDLDRSFTEGDATYKNQSPESKLYVLTNDITHIRNWDRKANVRTS